MSILFEIFVDRWDGYIWGYDNEKNKHEHTEWHHIVTFNKNADYVKQYLDKGCLVYIEGSLRSRIWKGLQNEEKKIVEIIADLAGALYQLNNALVEKVGEKNLPLFKIKSREKARTTMLNHLNQDNDDDSFPMKPQRVLSDVRKVMDDDDISPPSNN